MPTTQRSYLLCAIMCAVYAVFAAPGALFVLAHVSDGDR